jgi:hypothetical protein
MSGGIARRPKRAARVAEPEPEIDTEPEPAPERVEEPEAEVALTVDPEPAGHLEDPEDHFVADDAAMGDEKRNDD